jgi:adenylate cyclase
VPADHHRPVHTFVFADLAGYAALTEAHGDEQAADVAAEFARGVAASLDEHDAEVVKRIGDAVMIHARDPCCAVAVGRSLVQTIGDRPGRLRVRVGMHSGSAVQREGDWFGSTVNVASRVADSALAGEILMTDATHAAAGPALAALDVRAVGFRRFKNIADPVEVFSLRVIGEADADGLPIDPVCRMSVAPSMSIATMTHRGVEQHFCSEACAQRFRSAPDRYLGRRLDRLDLRVSDAARERAAARLGRAYRRGRLDADELETRLARAYTASVQGDLVAVTGDLPRRRGRPMGPLGLGRVSWRVITAGVRRRWRRHRKR